MIKKEKRKKKINFKSDSKDFKVEYLRVFCKHNWKDFFSIN